jgi:hypothetical protein
MHLFGRISKATLDDLPRFAGLVKYKYKKVALPPLDLARLEAGSKYNVRMLLTQYFEYTETEFGSPTLKEIANDLNAEHGSSNYIYKNEEQAYRVYRTFIVCKMDDGSILIVSKYGTLSSYMTQTAEDGAQH